MTLIGEEPNSSEQWQRWILLSLAQWSPRCRLGLTFSDFHLAPKRNEQPGYCGRLNLM